MINGRDYLKEFMKMKQLEEAKMMKNQKIKQTFKINLLIALMKEGVKSHGKMSTINKKQTQISNIYIIDVIQEKCTAKRYQEPLFRKNKKKLI